ncbi:MAG: hypothetical protein HC810_03405 [Acaryochloridaceae cyanobacterium RL_2_7]|nr:hypothetical protein [Acaryochloridaceae cyanobacterium RL_2_7]
MSNAFGTASNTTAVAPGLTNGVFQTAAEDNDRVFFADRVRLSLDSSFNGQDKLGIRLEAANIARLDRQSCGTELCRLGFDSNNGNAVELDELNYSFKPSDNLTIKVAPVGGELW